VDRVGERGVERGDVVHVIRAGAARHEDLLGHESPLGAQLVDDVDGILARYPVEDDGALCVGRGALGCGEGAAVIPHAAERDFELVASQAINGVPRDVREMYDRGLQYLVKTQNDAGGWTL